MRIYKVVVDKKPPDCFWCPIKGSSVKLDKTDCGIVTETKLGGGWVKNSRIPDERCLLEERQVTG